jgi:hypothetical protein
MSRKRKHKVEASELAQALVDEHVRKIIVDVAKNLHLNAATRARYETKMKLYQFTAVLMALMVAEQKNPRFHAVRVHFESYFFPPTPKQGAQHLAKVKKAMLDLNDLLTPAGRQEKPTLWARAWLQDIGIDETNPATLILIEHWWISYYVSVTKTLREFNPSA